MGKLVTYEEFKEYQRKKKYGCAVERLKGRGFPDDLNCGPDEPAEDHSEWLAQFIKTESHDEAEE